MGVGVGKNGVGGEQRGKLVDRWRLQGSPLSPVTKN